MNLITVVYTTSYSESIYLKRSFINFVITSQQEKIWWIRKKMYW